MADWRYDVDEANNRLYIDLSGEFTVDEAKRSTQRLREVLPELEPGFEVVTDIRGIIPNDDEVLVYLAEGKELIDEHGPAAAVRVEPESAVAEMQFDRTGEESEGYPVAKAESVEMAEELLEKRTDSAA
jgi:hypothetical protein